jgi:isopentenyl diphosphate isomerase/L-lactate dehydrogenase-like FMN-dependent dehydrogenase
VAYHPAYARRHKYPRPHRSVASCPNRDVRLIVYIITVELFGHTIPAPILFAPIGINKLYSPQGELVPAKIAGELGLPVGPVHVHGEVLGL